MRVLRAFAILPVLLWGTAAAPAPKTLQLSAADAAGRIFIGDPGAKAGTGTNGAQHVAGIRPAGDDDAGTQPVYAANGIGLGISLEKWRGARGAVEIESSGMHDRLTFHFANLIAFGTYSLFYADLTNLSPQTPIEALDGTGTSNTFTVGETGMATLTLTTPRPMGKNGALVLVYHSDGKAHGLSPGTVSIDAHEQIIAPLST